MQCHQCSFARCCPNYENDNCQGCSIAGATKKMTKDPVDQRFYEMLTDETKKYIKDHTEAYLAMKYSRKGISAPPIDKTKPGWAIKNVIFSNPATIVFWYDGSKTVVKCENEVYDPEKGLAMAIAKKALGNGGNYFNVFKKWLPEDYETPAPMSESRPWRIWYRHYDNGKLIGSGVYIKCYQRKNDATRVARKVYGDEEKYKFVVSMANPWKEG